MHLRILVLALLTAAYGFSAAVAVGTFQWVPLMFGPESPSGYSYFKVTNSTNQSDPNKTVLEEIRLENLKLYIEIESPVSPNSLSIKAFTLYPAWAVGTGAHADEIDPNEEPGNSNVAGFPATTLGPSDPANDLGQVVPPELRSRKFLDFSPGDGDVRITRAWLDFSAVAVDNSPVWTQDANTQFTPNPPNFIYTATLLPNGSNGEYFHYNGAPTLITLAVFGDTSTAVPEPSTIGMALAGIGLLVARRRFAR